MNGPFVHAIDPVITQVGPVYLWWYGASYTVGFLLAFWWARRVRAALGLDPAGVWLLAVMLSAGVLLGGRAVEVVFYEWAYYGRHPWHIPAVWLGGRSFSHRMYCITRRSSWDLWEGRKTRADRSAAE